MSEIAVSNSACLIAMDRIGRLDLLNNSFKQVFIPPAVQREFGRPINWLSVLQIKGDAVVAALKTQIGEGESEAIALAMEMQGSIIILDDKKARRIAKQLGLNVIGSIGLLLRAKKRLLIPEIKPLLDELQKVEFRITPELYQEALKQGKEI